MSRILLILGLLTTGCVTARDTASREPVDRPFGLPYDPATASALAFDPPPTIGLPLPDLSRDGRATEAFAGYEQQVTTFSYTHQRDEIRVQTDHGDLSRRAYTDRTSVTTR